MNNNKTSSSNKFAVTFATVLIVHVAMVGIFIGSVAYGETGSVKAIDQSSDKRYVGVDEQFPQPQNQQPVHQEQIIQPTQNTQSQNQPINNNTAAVLNNKISSQHTEVVEKSIVTKNVQQKHTKTTSYTVKSGDTLYSIAKKYKLDLNRLIKLNKIKDTNKLAVGQVLKFM